MPENQTVWNSDNHGIKETFTQTGRKEMGSWAGGRDQRQEGRLHGRGWLNGKLRLKASLNYSRGCQGGRNSQSHMRVC